MLPQWYLDYKDFVDKSIITYLDKYFEKNNDKILNGFKETIYYATKGGKRIRSIFAVEFFLIFSKQKFEDLKDDDDIIKICVAIECLHGYSLVHDDLPAMDNDLYRRGESTTWNKFGETNAILAGDMLNSLAFEILGDLKNKEIGYELIKLFGQAVGFYGMLGGQVLDLHYEYNSDEVTVDKLIETHNKKTGALITFSIISGVLISSYNGNLEKYLNFGKEIGLAFQVKDDLLDVEGTFEETGKSVGGEKKGFVHLIGIDESKKYLEKLIQNCLENISDLDSEKLNFLVEYIGSREK